MLPNDGRDFLHHQYKKKGASGAEDNVVQLEEELKLEGRLRLHNLTESEDDGQVGG